MTTSIMKPIFAIGLAVTAVVGIYIEHNRAERLAAENEALRAQVQQAEAATAELSTRIQASNVERPNDPSQTELLRLRGEVTRLRKSEAEMSKAREKEVIAVRDAMVQQKAQYDRAIATAAKSQEIIQLDSIGNNLRIIEGAKEQWALENRKITTDPVTLANLTAYFKNNTVPASVAGETYSVTPVGVLARATLANPLNGKTGWLTTTSF